MITNLKNNNNNKNKNMEKILKNNITLILKLFQQL